MDKNTIEKIGNIIKKRREELKISAKELAKVTGISPQLISMYENGKTEPTLTKFFMIAKALSLDLEKVSLDLFGEGGENNDNFLSKEISRILEVKAKEIEKNLIAKIKKMALSTV